MKICVTGGAGFIGTHICRMLVRTTEHKVIIVDNLSKFNGIPPSGIEEGCIFERGDIGDGSFMDQVFQKHKIDAVIHLAASIIVSESCEKPLEYYENNVVNSICLLQSMKRNNVQYIVFSSTAALFGNFSAKYANEPIEPDFPTNPECPYGESKLVFEGIMKYCGFAYGLKWISLRYFNACGSDVDGDIGQDPSSQLIPRVLQVAVGVREKISIFGNDYDTPDGSCVRDYIHVNDLASANILSLEYLFKGGESGCFNLGNSRGYSVIEIVEQARKVTGKTISAEILPRRAGDPASLIASGEKAKKMLGWVPKYDLQQILSTQFKYQLLHPNTEVKH